MEKNTVLKIENLEVSINETQILKGLNLEIKEGEVHALMGTNGAGKSTLVKTLSAHYDCVVTNGAITYKKKNLLDLDVAQRANEGIFMSFQSPIEVPGVNNSYFLKTAINEKRKYNGLEEIDAMEFLKNVKEETNKFNIDRKLLQRDLNAGFSGGEKKRNELVQLLMLQPDLILLDEIDSGLDVDSLKIVGQNVMDYYKQNSPALLVITHYQRLLDYIKPDFVHIMIDGSIIKTGDIRLVKLVEDNGYDHIKELV